MRRMNQKYKFTLSKPQPNFSMLAQTVLDLAELAERLALEERSVVQHVDGRPENVAEHSNMLAVIAPAIAEQYYSALDSNLVARYASIHDIVEAYVGDVSTHDISDGVWPRSLSLKRLGLRN